MYRNIYTLNIYERKIGHRENQLYLLSQVLWDVVPCSGVQTNLSWGTDHTWGTYQKNPGLQTTKSTTPMGIPHLPTQKGDSMITWDNPNHHNHTMFRSWSTQGQPGLRRKHGKHNGPDTSKLRASKGSLDQSTNYSIYHHSTSTWNDGPGTSIATI